MKNFTELPEWLKNLWDLNPTLAREAEKYLNDNDLVSKKEYPKTKELTSTFASLNEFIQTPPDPKNWEENTNYLRQTVKCCKTIDEEIIRSIFHSAYPIDFLTAFISAVENKIKERDEEIEKYS